MAIATKTKFAKLSMVNRSSITRAIVAGSLVVRPNGKLDTNNPVNKDYIKRCNDKKNQLSPADKSTEKNDQKPIRCTFEEAEQLSKDTEDKALGAVSVSSLNNLRAIEQISQIRMKTKKERQELIERSLVEKAFSKLYMIDVSMWRTLGANLSPEIAAITKIDDNKIIIEIEETIEKEVFVILQHIKRTMNEFLIGIEASQVE